MFDINELSIIRQSLDVISIAGKDAKYIATLQVKIEELLEQLSQPEPPKSSKNK